VRCARFVRGAQPVPSLLFLAVSGVRICGLDCEGRIRPENHRLQVEIFRVCAGRFLHPIAAVRNCPDFRRQEHLQVQYGAPVCFHLRESVRLRQPVLWVLRVLRTLRSLLLPSRFAQRVFWAGGHGVYARLQQERLLPELIPASECRFLLLELAEPQPRAGFARSVSLSFSGLVF